MDEKLGGHSNKHKGKHRAPVTSKQLETGSLLVTVSEINSQKESTCGNTIS